MMNQHVRDQLSSLKTEHFLTESFRGLRLFTDLIDTGKVKLANLDEAVMSDGTRLSGWSNLSLDMSAAGAGGLDTGAAQLSTWYEVHAIAKDDGTKAIMAHRAKDYYLDQSQTTNDVETSVNNLAGTSVRVAQSFQLSTADKVECVEVMLRRDGSPTGVIYFTIEADSAGAPSGTPLATSASLLPAGIAATSQIVRLLFRTPATHAATTTYWLVARPTYAASDTNRLIWRANSAGGYANGTCLIYNGATWSSAGGRDQYFKIYVTRNDAALTLPTGYTKSVLLCPGIYRDGSGNMRQSTVIGRHVGYRHLVVLNASTVTVPTLVDLAVFVPPRPVVVEVGIGSTVAGDQIAVGGAMDGYDQTNGGGADRLFNVAAAAQVECLGPLIQTEYQALYARRNAGTGSVSVYCNGYEW